MEQVNYLVKFYAAERAAREAWEDMVRNVAVEEGPIGLTAQLATIHEEKYAEYFGKQVPETAQQAREILKEALQQGIKLEKSKGKVKSMEEIEEELMSLVSKDLGLSY